MLLGVVALFGLADAAATTVIDATFIARIGAASWPLGIIVRAIALLAGLALVGVARDRGRGVDLARAAFLGAALVAVAAGVVVAAAETDAAVGVMFVIVGGGFGIAWGAVLPTVAEIMPAAHGRSIARPALAALFAGQALGALGVAILADTVPRGAVVVAGALASVVAAGLLGRVDRLLPIRLDIARQPRRSLPSPARAFAEWRRAGESAIGMAKRSPLLGYLFGLATIVGALGVFIDTAFAFELGSRTSVEAIIVDLGFARGVAYALALIVVIVGVDRLRRSLGSATLVSLAPIVMGIVLLARWPIGLAVPVVIPFITLNVVARAIDEPTRRFAEGLYPADARREIEWLLHRLAPTVALATGAALMALGLLVVGVDSVAALIAAATVAWIILSLVFRGRYGALVMTTSLVNRLEYEQAHVGNAREYVDNDAIQMLEAEIAGGVPARAQLAIELLRQVAVPRLPYILASTYLRQSPVLRPLFLSTIQAAMRDSRQNDREAHRAAGAIQRLARTRLGDTERAILVRVYSESASRHHFDPRETRRFLEGVGRTESRSILLAVAGAQHRLYPEERRDRDALVAAIQGSLAALDEQEVHLAVSEIEELARFDPERDIALLDLLLPIIGEARRSPRIRAHIVGTVSRLRALIDPERRENFDRSIVPLALDSDPRLVSAALELLADPRYASLIETHVLPNLNAGNHHVRERATEAIRAFGEVAVPALLDVVRSGNRRERVAVANLLAAYPVPRAEHDAVIAMEVRGLARKIAMAALLAERDDPTMHLLRLRIDEETAEHSRAITRLLFAESGDEFLLRVEKQLWSRDPALRSAALEGLDRAARHHHEAKHARTLIGDDPLATRARLARTIEKDVPATAAEVVWHSAIAGHWVTRLIVAYILGRGEHSESRELLGRLHDDGRASVRDEAERSQLLAEGTPLAEEMPMTTVERMLLLKETELFRNLEARDLAGIANVVHEARFKGGEAVIREGDRGDFLAIIAHGDVDIMKNTPDGKQIHIRALGRGAVIGEIALLDEGPRSASVIAKTPSHVLTLSRVEFETLIEEYPGVALGISRVLAQRLQTMTAQAAGARK